MCTHIFENGYTIYTGNEASKKFVIFLHSLTQDSRSEFARYIIQKIVDVLDYSVLTFDWDFFRFSRPPSVGLEQEMMQLKQAIQYANTQHRPKEIYLVGKSLGGVIALATARKMENFPRIIILGWPLAFGFPPRVELLDGRSFEPFDYQQEYRYLLDQVKKPIDLIQGDADDLCPIKECKAIMKGYPNMSLDIVKGANHAFMIDHHQAFDQCAQHLIVKLDSSSRIG